ncbi:helix-turn-helix domain-containing protein [Leucobacter sp. M11]|uniref:helix-turn-helix domain-containing protein n=1 Tax=Leucobacter sp. M11 TaxID=2993565 RepID=UPI002D80277D|nr:GAF domain-containing protein [Leucobacter sp. M11]MEB4616595.1 GAF domain-containing protein [Leucobacter sp. M11]
MTEPHPQVPDTHTELPLALLEALVAEASAAQLTELAAARPSGPAGERSLAAALALRDSLDHLRAREQSLTQLVSSARDLAGLDAVDTVLRSIVARSRRLLMADVAYFLRFDPETEGATMVVSEGIVSDAFARLSVQPREGIAGYIASTRKPSWTADYLSDPVYQHSGTIDDATTEEGLRAILGVPVLFSGRVVGVLLAADRRVHDYRPEDVDLLFSLAQHAGILIENATVHEQGRAEVERLEASLESHRASEAGTSSLLRFQDQLLALLMSTGTAAELARLTREAVGGQILITDRAGFPIAVSPGPLRDPGDPERDQESLALLGDADTPLGWLSHRPETPESPGLTPDAAGQPALREQILSRAATVAGLILSRQQASRTGAREQASDYVHALLHNPEDEHAHLLRAGLAVRVDTLSVVLAARVEEQSLRGPLIRAAQDAAERRGGLGTAITDGALLWLPGTDLSGSARDVAQHLSQALGSPVTVGAVALSQPPQRLAPALAAAQDTARALVALGRSGEGVTRTEIAPLPSILARSTPEELADFVSDVLGAIIDYDDAHGTELLSTLRVVYDHGGNVTTAAPALFVHANTVHQRLSRIDTLTSENWRDSDVTMRRQLALRVRALAASSQSRTQPRKAASHVQLPPQH